VIFQTTGTPQQTFGKLTLVKPDGTKQPLLPLLAQSKASQEGVILNLQGAFDRLSGSVDSDPKLRAKIIYQTPSK
jgi:hypothetical protein